MLKYNFQKIEKKWQKIWAKNNYKLWHSRDSKSENKNQKQYILDMFPYPSGEGLHVGHIEGYTASDIISRYLRMKGFNVLHPMGWDAFGLPAENYAIKIKIHPKEVVKKNIKKFKKQLQNLGFSYDWQRGINTTNPEYYKWTQWIFLQLFKKGLAYEISAPINWCSSCKTVLANEEVIEGACDRCGARTQKKYLKQWMLKITKYADDLLKDLEKLDWPDRVKEMQKNWIGKSEGVEIEFRIKNLEFVIPVFTTRADTLDGATYVVLSPEHSLIENLKLKIQNWSEITKYIKKARNKSERERQENKEKTGVELKGIKAINPLNGEELPVLIADYVLIHYGTGAIMAVPQHDERDREFAQKFNLPIINRPLIPKEKVIKKIGAKKTVNYKLRDWVFSRQRYWGEPIPIIKCKKCGNVPVSEKDLPVELPKVRNYQPTGKTESPLAGIKKWVNVKCPKCGSLAKRETNTMPQWAGSNWYYSAYVLSEKLKVKSEKLFWNKKLLDYWLPVDLYIGGIEHAVLHLLYARFWHKFLYDIGIIPTREPFYKLINQGLILGSDNQKMSKSRGNIVSPDDMIEKFGADSLRLYEMFMGPLEDVKPWQSAGIVGMHRFLQRVYNFYSNPPVGGQNSKLKQLLHKTIKKVTEDIENFRFNTAISALMILLNEAEKQKSLNSEFFISYLKLLFLFAPHLAQELWQKLGNKILLDYEDWLEWDEKLVQEENFELVIQINGKMRDKVPTFNGITQKEAKELILKREIVKKWINDKPIKKIIFVPDKLINLII